MLKLAFALVGGIGGAVALVVSYRKQKIHEQENHRAKRTERSGEHGLRHLAWLLREDEAIHHALADWSRALSEYEPEPFRAFGREPGF